MAVFVVTQESWKQDPWHAILMTAYFIVAIIWGYRQWRNRPRFHSVQANWAVVPVMMGLVTLIFFNFHQYEAQVGAGRSHMASSAEVWIFNSVTVLAYAVLIGTLVWKSRVKFRLARLN